MFQRLIAHIDALGDRVHPIVVLQARRYFRNRGRGAALFVWTTLLAVAALGVFMYVDVLFADPAPYNYHTELIRILRILIIFQLSLFGIGKVFGCWQQYVLLEKTIR